MLGLLIKCTKFKQKRAFLVFTSIMTYIRRLDVTRPPEYAMSMQTIRVNATDVRKRRLTSSAERWNTDDMV